LNGRGAIRRTDVARGTVKWFNRQDDGPDVFVHISAVQKAGYTNLVGGARRSSDG
jgi:CspA family cold shock protein